MFQQGKPPDRRRGGASAIQKLPEVPLDQAGAAAFPSVPAQETAVVPARMKVTRIGLEGFPSSFEEWEAFGRTLRDIEKGLQWAVGDWLNIGEARYRDKYMGAAAALGFEVPTVRDYAYVARSIKPSIRIDTLSFAHHRLIASLDPQFQRHWLTRADAAGWSVSRMREEMRGDKVTKSWYVKSWTPTYNRLDKMLNTAPISELPTVIAEVEEWLKTAKDRIENKP